MAIKTFLFPLLYAFIGWILLTLLLKMISPLLQRAIAASIEQGLRKRLEQVEVSETLTQIIHDRMDRVIGQFKKQMPMAEMFLTPTISATIRQLATSELLSAWPELRSAVGEQLLHDKTLIESSKLAAAERWIPWLGAAIGLALGLIFH